jgi:Xaa-Pro aminopeptidase
MNRRCNEPGCHMTYDIQHDTLSLFIPRIDEKRVIWNGRGSTLAEALVRYDVDEVYYSDEVADYIADWQHHDRNKGSLYILHSKVSSMRNHSHGRIDSTSLLPAMNIARMVKDDHEIKLIRKANHISSNAHKAVLANILKFKNEAQVQGLFLNVCVSHQAKEQAYDPIAASGPNAGTLHYDANNEDFGNRQLMCLDAGCEFELYASDITRTFPLSSSWPSKEAAEIYKLVERMQETCIKRLAPGVRYLDLHILAHQIAIDGLLALGILHNGTKEEIYKAGTSRAFFPHGLGHHMGLEVHDVGQAELMSIRRGKHIFEQVRDSSIMMCSELTYPSRLHYIQSISICLYTTPRPAMHQSIRRVAIWKRVWSSLLNLECKSYPTAHQRRSQTHVMAAISRSTHSNAFTYPRRSTLSTSMWRYYNAIYQLVEYVLKTIFSLHPRGMRTSPLRQKVTRCCGTLSKESIVSAL